MKNKNILVIDDEPDILELFTRALKEYSVKTAQNEEETLKLISQEEFDLVFLDIVLSKTDGLELLQTIRKIRPKVKIIMMTGFAVEEKINQALKMGAVGVMRKPFKHIADLPRAVERALTRQFV